jgi:voltage-gated potassium channel
LSQATPEDRHPAAATEPVRELARPAAIFGLSKDDLRQLYEGETLRSMRFRYALLALDMIAVLFIVTTSFLPRTLIIEALDVVFGVWILADFSARLLISRAPLQEFTRVSTWTDIVVIISFLAPSSGEAGGFLRPLRTLTLLRDFRMVAQLRADSPFFVEMRKSFSPPQASPCSSS